MIPDDLPVDAPVVDVALLDALEDELSRAVAGLALPDSPPIYHLRFKLAALRVVSVHTRAGAVLEQDDDVVWSLGVEVRVGDVSFDNTGFGGWSDGFRATGLPRVPTVLAVQRDAWRLTDAAYKDAVEQYARKQAQAVLPPDHPGDYLPLGQGGVPATPLVVAPEGQGRAPSLDALRDAALGWSTTVAVRRDQQLADVWDAVEVGVVWTLDSEGARVGRTSVERSTRLVARTVLSDGTWLTSERLVSDRAGGADARTEAAEAIADELRGLVDARPLTGEYVGPVVFLDDAAVDVFRTLLVPQLGGTPAEIPFDTFFGDLGRRGDAVRLHRRVLPRGWDVIDGVDVTELPGVDRRWDDESVPLRETRLVSDGIVTSLLMSRTPRADLRETNGHGRSSPYDRAVGKVVDVHVDAPGARSERALIARGLKEARAYGLDHVLVVRRLLDPAIAVLDRPDLDVDDGPVLGEGILVERHHADGTVEVLRSVRFAGVDRRVLRDVIAAGPTVERVVLEPLQGDRWGLGPTEGSPTRFVVPGVLVGELEVVPVVADPASAPGLPAP